MQLDRLLWLMSAPGGGRTILFMSFDQPQRQMGSLRTSRGGLRMACLEVSCLGRTRFVIREGAAPARVDSCVMLPASRPAKCPRR